MIASVVLASALAASAPLAAPVVEPVAAAAPVAPSAVKHEMAEGKMDCCKDGCECCGKDKAAKAEPEHEHAH